MEACARAHMQARTGETLDRDVKPHQPLRKRREAQLCAMELMACRYDCPDTCSCHSKQVRAGSLQAVHSASSICDVPTSRVDAEALCLGDLAFGDALSGSRRASASLDCPSPLPSPLAMGLPPASRLALLPGPLSVFLSRLMLTSLSPSGTSSAGRAPAGTILEVLPGSRSSRSAQV